MTPAEIVITTQHNKKAVRPEQVVQFYMAAHIASAEDGGRQKDKHERRQEAEHWLIMLAALWDELKGRTVMQVYAASMKAQTAAYRIGRIVLHSSLQGAFEDAAQNMLFAKSVALIESEL